MSLPLCCCPLVLNSSSLHILVPPPHVTLSWQEVFVSILRRSSCNVRTLTQFNQLPATKNFTFYRHRNNRRGEEGRYFTVPTVTFTWIPWPVHVPKWMLWSVDNGEVGVKMACLSNHMRLLCLFIPRMWWLWCQQKHTRFFLFCFFNCLKGEQEESKWNDSFTQITQQHTEHSIPYWSVIGSNHFMYLFSCESIYSVYSAAHSWIK